MNEHSKLWNRLDVCLCLNQPSRLDRWKLATEEFQRVGLTAERFYSIPAESPHQSFCLSQYAMLKTFLATGKKTGLLLEDDVVFRDLAPLEAAWSELPQNWDALYLGANITAGVFGIKENPPVRYSDNLYSVRRAWTSHAIVYTKEAAQRIVTVYNPYTCGMYDNFLSEHMLPKLNAFVVNPMVAFQRPGKSDLWGNHADYTEAFEASNKIMER